MLERCVKPCPENKSREREAGFSEGILHRLQDILAYPIYGIAENDHSENLVNSVGCNGVWICHVLPVRTLLAVSAPESLGGRVMSQTRADGPYWLRNWFLTKECCCKQPCGRLRDAFSIHSSLERQNIHMYTYINLL